MLGDVLQVAVPLCWCGLGRVARHRGRARRDDDSRFRVALSDAVVNTILVIRAYISILWGAIRKQR